MSTTCIIEFSNNPACSFYGGQIMSAKVILNVNEPQKLEGIALKITGSADTRWTEHNHRHNKHRSSTTYSGHEDYINIKTFLLGEPNKSITLQTGTHEFFFNYNLPITCPSSVESQYGHIRYKVKVILIRPWNFDQTFTKGLTVVKLVDLNQQPMIACPITQQRVKQFGFFPWKTPPLNMTVILPQSGYVPGQKIPVSVAILNESGKNVLGLKIALIMITTCYTQTPSRHVRDHKTKVSKIKDECSVNQMKENSIYELPVPPCPPSDNTFSTLIQISYQVEVEAVMPMMQPNQVMTLPVVIGSIPLTSVTQTQPLLPTTLVVTPPYEKGIETEIVTDSTQTPITPPWEMGASNISPPSYEEAMYMSRANISENEEHDYGESDFAPLYPVFHINNSIPNDNDENKNDSSKEHL